VNNLRHYVDVIGPADVTDSRGQNQSDKPLMSAVPCSIEILNGREAEIARQLLPQATMKVTMRGPIPGLGSRCKLQEYPIANGVPRATHHVGYVQDPLRTGRVLVCLCTEET
jgi:hypothetical protein